MAGVELTNQNKDGYNALVQNPTYTYFQTNEKLHGFLSQQFPTIANPAPLGLCGFALTTFVLSFYNAGAIIGKLTVMNIDVDPHLYCV